MINKQSNEAAERDLTHSVDIFGTYGLISLGNDSLREFEVQKYEF